MRFFCTHTHTRVFFFKTFHHPYGCAALVAVVPPYVGAGFSNGVCSLVIDRLPCVEEADIPPMLFRDDWSREMDSGWLRRILLLLLLLLLW